MKLVVIGPEGQSAVARSEQSARRLARRWLGVDRVYETPEPDGWLLWPPGGTEDSKRVVRVRVL